MPALTINKVCGSGLKAVMLAAQAVRCGDAEIVVAGGQENMSAVAARAARTRAKASAWATGRWSTSMIADGLWDVYNQYHMGTTAENVAKKYGITREKQDALALALAAEGRRRAGGRPLQGRDPAVHASRRRRAIPIVFAADEFINRKTSADALAGLRPAFDKAGSVTAGNASGLNDGAAAVLVMSAQRAAALGLQPLARDPRATRAPASTRRSWAWARCRLRSCAWRRPAGSAQDLDLMEINEAFAAQACAVNQEMGWDTSKINVNGGAIAHRPPDRCVGLPHPGDAAARDAPPRRQQGPGLAVHRRRHGRGAGGRARLSNPNPEPTAFMK